jgi:hypothetical protein
MGILIINPNNQHEVLSKLIKKLVGVRALAAADCTCKYAQIVI